MPTPAYLSVTGEKQGNITEGALTQDSVGSIWVKGHENEIIVQGLTHEVEIPTDPQSGMPAGPRKHKRMTVTKVFDKSSPLLYQALTSGEHMSECVLKWYRTSKTGQQEHYFTIKLIEAIIVNIHAYMPNCQDPGKSNFTHLEDVSFAYRKIIWTHEKSGTEAEDDWQEPEEE